MQFDWLLNLGVTLYGVLLIGLSLRILIRRRPVGVTLSWLLFLYVLPGLGMLFYLMFGERYLGRLRARRADEQFDYYANWLVKLQQQHQHKVPVTALTPAMMLTARSLGMPAIQCDSWQSFNDTHVVFEQLINDIDLAHEVILMEFYIVEADGAVEPVLNALERAADRGVTVLMMLDSVGANVFLRSSRCRALREHGIKVIDVLHANLLRMAFRRQDLRQHRKLLAIDNRIAYTGSMNLVDPVFFKTKAGVGQWIDIMVRLEGDIARIIQGTLIFDWEMETGIRLEKYLRAPQFNAGPGAALMQLLPSGPALDEDILLQVLLTAIHTAQRQVIITTPYFVPDEAVLQALMSAAKRGLEVTVIVPRRNDSKLAQFAGRSFYYELLNAGVNICRFNGGLLHSKTVIIDDEQVLIGSVNLDMRSIWLNFEATLIVRDLEFCRDIRAIVQDYENDSHRLKLDEWQQRPYHKRMLENIAQLASPLL